MRPAPCFPNESLQNVIDAPRATVDASSVYIAEDSVEAMARELMAWRGTSGATTEEVTDLQVRAMRSIAEHIRMSMATYADAVDKSADIQARLVANPAPEIRDVFELIIRRAYAVIESAEKSAKAETS